MRENGETPNFEDVIKQALKPKPLKLKVVLNAANPVYPKQIKSSDEVVGISIKGYTQISINRLTSRVFDISPVTMKFYERKKGEPQKLQVRVINENMYPDNPIFLNMSRFMYYELLVFELDNKEVLGDVSFEVELS